MFSILSGTKDMELDNCWM